MPGPTSPKVEIEFTSSVWTDVSSDVNWAKNIQWHIGRSSEFSGVQPGTLAFELDDTLGNYTPLNSSSAYYPNVVPRKRVRVSLNGGANVVFVGYITGWPPTYEDHGRRIIQVQAVDRLEQFGRVTLKPILQQTVLRDGVTAYWPLSDPTGTPVTSISEITGNQATQITYQSTQKAADPTNIAFGASNPLPVPDNTTGATLALTGTSTALAKESLVFTNLSGMAGSPTAFSMECWVTTAQATVNQGQFYFGCYDETNYFAGGVAIFGNCIGGVWTFKVTASTGGGNSFNGTTYTTAIPDGVFHIAVTTSFSAPLTTTNLYVNGVLAETDSLNTVIAIPYPGKVVFQGQNYQSTTSVSYTVSNISVVNGNALTGGQITSHYNCGANGLAGSLTSDRFQSYLANFDPLISYSWGTGTTVMGAHPVGGKDMATALAELATTEGGGSVVYVAPSGSVTFESSTYRNATTPVVTWDALADLDGTAFQPSFDALQIVNQSTVTRNGGTTYTYNDATSQSLYGVFNDSATSYANTDQSAINLAQDRVARLAYPALRIPQVTVDIFTSPNSTALYAGFVATGLGDRVRINNIPTTLTYPSTSTTVRQFPRSQFDFYVEGWSVTMGFNTFTVTYDLSPADNPARMLWSDAVYGRWQASSSTLNATITAGATSLAIATALGSTWSTSAGDYPMLIKIDEEVLQISSAPGSSSSPQTVTVTRGLQGTAAAAHTGGNAVNVYPTATWTM